MLVANPGKGIKKLQQIEHKNVPFTDDQRRILEAYLKTHDYPLYEFTRFIYYTFIRPVELLRLRVTHVDTQAKIIVVRSRLSKNKRQMSVTIPKGLDPFIQEMQLKNHDPNCLLFAKGLVRGMAPQARQRITERHSRAMKACGVYDGEVTMYSWKHTGNCNAYRAGADIKALQAQNRHQSLEMTDIYLRSMGLQQQQKLRNLEW